MKESNHKLLIILDNDYNPDIRVQNEIISLQEEGIIVTLMCFGFTGIEYPIKDDCKVIRIPMERSKKNKLFFFSSTFGSLLLRELPLAKL